MIYLASLNLEGKDTMAVHEETLASSFLEYVAYDDETREMTLTMSGGDYTFYQVPKDVYDQLVNSPSPGKFYHSSIRGRFA